MGAGRSSDAPPGEGAGRPPCGVGITPLGAGDPDAGPGDGEGALACGPPNCPRAQPAHFDARDPRRVHPALMAAEQRGPENVGSRSPLLLQSDFPKPFSALVTGAVERRSGRGSRAELDTATAERARESLSEWPALSGAWGSGDPVYKVQPVDPVSGRAKVGFRQFAVGSLAGRRSDTKPLA